MNAVADADPVTLRISIDTMATVNVGEYSKGGRSRGLESVKALNHDMCPKEKLVPGGILEPVTGRSFLFFGTSYKTSDFIVDGLHLWWEERRQELCGLKQLAINMYNGPERSGLRTQFLLRLTEFADKTGFCVRIIYYPPYHSNYNSIERYWAGYEKLWNDYLLDTVDTVIRRVGNFFWKRLRTTAQILDRVYEKGVKVCGDEKVELEQRLQRSPILHWWDITIQPKAVNL